VEGRKKASKECAICCGLVDPNLFALHWKKVMAKIYLIAKNAAIPVAMRINMTIKEIIVPIRQSIRHFAIE
jgi:hypothetical protein